ncbi:autotransporter outer membrane beta-barrel domain-containing protein [Salmonella enterica subsp. enterica serovar Infantis]|nr:autotransporter outer membrane beta-barrel domain-containing protein [Salmonella enterica subsp. enterica serovar Infantis]
MAVENKFKRNFLAASILVGLSLSATSGVAWAEDKTGAVVALPESPSVASESSSLQSALDVKESAEGESLPSQSTQDPTGPGHTEEDDNSSSASSVGGEISSEVENVQADAAQGGKVATEEEGQISASDSESASKESSAKDTEDNSVKTDGNKPQGLFDKIAEVVKDAFGGDSDKKDNTELHGDEPAGLSGGKNDAGDLSIAENKGKNGVSDGEILDSDISDDGAGKKPELDGKPVVNEDDGAGKKPELDGKPVVNEDDGAGKKPELDGKPVVNEDDGAGKKPELDGKPVVNEDDGAGKKPELDGKPVVDEKPVEKPAIVKPVEPKRIYSAAELNTYSESKPLTETLVVNVAPSATDTASVIVTMGDAASKGGKVTPSSVWAQSDVALTLGGDLHTAQPELDKDGKPVAGKLAREADKIVLQNLNIHNSMPSLADRVDMLHSDIVGIQIGTQTTSATGALSAAPKDASILLDNVNITMQNGGRGTKAIDLTGNSNHILAKGGVIDAGEGYNASILDITGSNNVVDFVGSTLKGDIKSAEIYRAGQFVQPVDNAVNLKGSTLTGNAIADTGSLSLMLDGSTWTGRSGEHSPDITLRNGSVWNVTGSNAGANRVWSDRPYSSVNSLNLYGSNTLNLIAPAEGKGQLGGRGFVGDGDNRSRMLQVDTDLKSDGKGITTVNIGAYSPYTLHRLNNIGLGDDYAFGRIEVDGLALGGKYRLNVESSGAEPYTIGGRLADDAGATGAHEFVSYKTSENRPVKDKDGKAVSQIAKSDADFISLSAPAELGVYQYAAEKVVDGVNNRTNIYYSSTGKLSNSAATVVSLAAAPVDVANLESDTLAKHMNSVRHGKGSGVWVSYFGGENRNTTAAGPEYTLKTNGVMLGADTLTENNWLAGVAVSSARSDMSVMNSSGDLNSYGAQFYMSRRYDTGVFVDSALQFNHFSNTAKVRMIDGQQAKADFSGNSYGLEAKVGYTWNSEGFFAEPYVRAAARAFDGEHYNLSNGMTVNNNDYKSMLGEVGADVGYQYDISGGYVKPYLHLAALNEFADGNSVRVNNVSLDNSVKGAAFQAGLGAEVKVTDNLGGYAAFDYTKGDNTERPWQATVGVNYTW